MEMFWIIYDIQANLKSLQQIKIQHSSRNCNEIAHLLAKKALEQ